MSVETPIPHPNETGGQPNPESHPAVTPTVPDHPSIEPNPPITPDEHPAVVDNLQSHQDHQNPPTPVRTEPTPTPVQRLQPVTPTSSNPEKHTPFFQRVFEGGRFVINLLLLPAFSIINTVAGGLQGAWNAFVQTVKSPFVQPKSTQEN